LFGIIHDSKRLNESTDPEHGIRSADYAQELFAKGLLKISESQLEKLDYACRYHNEGKISNDKTIGCCWDADRLDLVRLSEIPNKKLLSTDSAKKLLWKM